MSYNEKDISYILKHLHLISLSIEQICDDILSTSLPIGRVMNFRYLYLDLYLWRGYVNRLLKTEYNDFAKDLLKDFSQKVCNDNSKIECFRNRATHYSADCEMDIMLTIKEDKEVYPRPDLPSYKDIKKYFADWNIQILSKIAETQPPLICEI